MKALPPSATSPFLSLNSSPQMALSVPPILPISNQNHHLCHDPPIATPTFRALISHVIESFCDYLSQRRPWAELIRNNTFSKPKSIPMPPFASTKLLLLLLQLPHTHSRILFPHESAVIDPLPWTPRRQALPLPLLTLRSSSRRLSLNLLLARDARIPDHVECRCYLPHERQICSDICLACQIRDHLFKIWFWKPFLHFPPLCVFAPFE